MARERRPLWYLYLLLKNRWFMVKGLLIIMIPTVVFTFMLSKKYTVSTLIMPPEEQVSAGMSIAGLGLSEFAGYFSGGMGFSLPLMTTMSDVYEEILRSRTLADKVILSTAFVDSMDLRQRFQQSEELGMYWARKKFNEKYKVELTPSGFIRIQFTSSNPWYAVEISEEIVAKLDSINRSISLNRLENSREFLQQRLEMAESSLDSSRRAMRQFEEEYGFISPEAEMEYYINYMTELKTQYAQLRTEISALRQGISGAPNASLLFKERQAAELLDVIQMLETGEPSSGYEEIVPDVSRSEFPELSLQYAVLEADYKMSLQVLGAVKASLQEAIAAENREQAPVRVLDRPSHPGWKSKPKKLFIWLEVFVLAFFGLFAYLVARENVREVKKNNPKQWEPWRKLLNEIKGDFTFRKK